MNLEHGPGQDFGTTCETCGSAYPSLDASRTLLNSSDLIQALTKEQQTNKKLVELVEKININLRETCKTLLASNVKKTSQIKKYHQIIIQQLPTFNTGYQKGYQAGLEE